MDRLGEGFKETFKEIKGEVKDKIKNVQEGGIIYS